MVVSPPYVPPGHCHSPQTSDIDRSRAMRLAGSPAVGIHLDADGQLDFATAHAEILVAPVPGPRYAAENSMFGPADAAVYRAVLRHLRPSRIIEVGSGYSTAVALDEADAAPSLRGVRLTCIEPCPQRLLGLLQESDAARVTVIRRVVQDVALDVFDQLQAGDILFIDSTHVVKAGSDVVWLFLHVLPRLAAGVVVHVHDIFWPFEYPAAWLTERRDWTEAYLVHAFLCGNEKWEILFFASWFWREHPELVPSALIRQDPGSIWLRKVR